MRVDREVIDGSTSGIRSNVEEVRNFKTILKNLIPENTLKLIPRSYDVVGDIAIINLPKELLSYGEYVGKAILAVSKNVKAVYAAGMTVGEFRVRELTHIAGERRTATTHKEYGIKIYVDISNTYYNPSLSEERRRVANKVVDGESVLDLFTGVGPFTLHIACTKKAYIIANDLNHHATQCLRRSLELNRKALKGVVDIVNGDALEVLNSIRDNSFDKAVLNLPHKSTNYLDETYRTVKEGGTIYTYLIATDKVEALNTLKTAVKSKPKVGEVVRVLDYAPRKYVFRLELIKN